MDLLVLIEDDCHSFLSLTNKSLLSLFAWTRRNPIALLKNQPRFWWLETAALSTHHSKEEASSGLFPWRGTWQLPQTAVPILYLAATAERLWGIKDRSYANSTNSVLGSSVPIHCFSKMFLNFNLITTFLPFPPPNPPMCPSPNFFKSMAFFH